MNLTRPWRLLLLPAVLCTGFTLHAWAANAWPVDTAQSSLTFSGTQAGAPFSGTFAKFTPDIRFDPKDLGTSRFDVTIDLASVNSKDAERDDTIRSDDFFAVKRWPTARYVAEQFVDRGGGKYTATGRLTLRDVTRDVPLEFTLTTDAKGTWLRGDATLRRLDFGVGQGEWKDTSWVGNDVRVTFALRLRAG